MMSTVFLNGDIIEISQDRIDKLKHAATAAPLKRARLCLHRDHDDPVQEMLIAFCKGSYVRPHRHVGKSESFHIVEGELLVVFFGDEGNVARTLRMGPLESGLPFMYRLQSDLWHSAVPLSEFVLLHEITTGPFVRNPGDFPEWAPDYDDEDGIKQHLEKIRTKCR
jgi:cupin fold WbuC family metalloprotein